MLHVTTLTLTCTLANSRVYYVPNGQQDVLHSLASFWRSAMLVKQGNELHGFYLQQIIHTLLTEYSPKTRTFWEHSPEVFQVLIPAYDPPLE